MGRQVLVSHAAGKKHILLTNRFQTFFQTKTVTESSVLDKEQSTGSPSSSKKNVEVAFDNTDVIKADILWVLKCITSSYSINSCTHIEELFRTMFPDSEVAKKFQVGPNKVKYLTNYGIKLYVKSLLDESIKNSEFFIISFDESLNKVTQDCDMDILIRYFDSTENLVKTRFYDSRFLGHSTHSDLLEHFNDMIKELNPNKLYQISMDEPSVNLKFYDKVAKERGENEQHVLINIGTCGIHTTHGATSSPGLFSLTAHIVSVRILTRIF